MKDFWSFSLFFSSVFSLSFSLLFSFCVDFFDIEHTSLVWIKALVVAVAVMEGKDGGVEWRIVKDFLSFC